MSQSVHLRKYGVQTTIDFELYEIDGVDFRVDAADASDITIMKDEGAEANTTNSFTDEGTGYSIVLTATEMQAERIMLYVVDSATKVWLDKCIVIETYGHASAMHEFDLDTPLKSNIDTIESDIKILDPIIDTIASDLIVTDAVADTIASDLIVADTVIDTIASDLIVADAIVDKVYSDTTAIASGVNTVESDLTILDTVADTIASDLIVADVAIDNAYSDTTVIASDLKVLDTVADTIASDLIVTDAVADTIASDLLVVKTTTDDMADAATTLVSGTVSWDNTNATTTVFYCDDITEATADHYKGREIIFTSGALQGQATDITTYALDTGEGKFTVTALTEPPADNVTFVII